MDAGGGSGTGGIRILLVDGDAARTAALAGALRGVRGMEVVGEVADGRAASSAVLALNPDVVLMAVRLPVVSGPEAAERLAALCPRVRVLGVDGQDEPFARTAMWHAGVVDIVSAQTSIEDLAAAITRAVVEA